MVLVQDITEAVISPSIKQEGSKVEKNTGKKKHKMDKEEDYERSRGVCGIHGLHCPHEVSQLASVAPHAPLDGTHGIQLVTLVLSIAGGYVAVRVVCIPFKPENLRAQHTEDAGGLLRIFSTDSTGKKVLNSITYSATQLRLFSWTFSNITHVHVETEHPDSVLRPSMCGYEAEEICPKNVCGTIFLEGESCAVPSKRLIEAGMAVHKQGKLGHGYQINGAVGSFTISSNKPVIAFSAARDLEETVSFVNSFLEKPCMTAPSVHMAVYSSRISHMVSFQVRWPQP